MKRFAILSAAIAVSTLSGAQIRVDGNFPFQSDPAKQYSLYIPSGYSPTTPHRLMLGLHPFNTSTWNSVSWCDTLVDFAEANNLILACPDGGIDGKVDDPIDTAFTSALLDSVEAWYNIDTDKVYAMGFSWGGKTTYTYGLSHVWRFGGFIPIGAAINGTSEVTGIIQQALSKPFFIVHGANDAPGSRFYPIRSALIMNGAIVEDTLMPGIGHTINFPNRNQILGMAYHWVDSVNCASLPTSVAEPLKKDAILAYPNPSGGLLLLDNIPEMALYTISDLNGRTVLRGHYQEGIDLGELPPGKYSCAVYRGKDLLGTVMVIRP